MKNVLTKTLLFPACALLVFAPSVRAADAKPTLEDEEIDAERPRPNPRGDGGLGGTVEAGHHGDPGDGGQ